MGLCPCTQLPTCTTTGLSLLPAEAVVSSLNVSLEPTSSDTNLRQVRNQAGSLARARGLGCSVQHAGWLVKRRRKGLSGLLAGYPKYLPVLELPAVLVCSRRDGVGLEHGMRRGMREWHEA